MILTSDSPDQSKVTDLSPIFKKDDPQKSKNYRLVCVLPVASKVFELLLHKQIVCMLNNICHHICVVIEKGLMPDK